MTTSAAEPVVFNRDIRPLMADTCFKCHGPGTQKAGLRLDRREHATRVAESGRAPIVPGKPEQSEVLRRVLSTDEDQVMPPPSAHKTLTPLQRETLRRWVAEGATYQRHWSFESPVAAALPPIPATTPADAFLNERLRREHLAATNAAAPATLVRRLAFTLTGLPPQLDELDDVAAAPGPDALARLADKYLAAPRFGEEMARHWLDVARYGDTHGLHLDNERQMWLYRDWVVQAFNRGLPFDRFTVEQLAGDLLPQPTTEQLIATGFNRCNVTTGEGGSINEEWVFRNAVDRATTTAETWLGLTAGCCVCHDHKFDPLSARDFYSFYAFFLSAADPPLDGNALLTGPTVKALSSDQEARAKSLDAQLAVLRAQLSELAAATAYADPADADPRPPVMRYSQTWFDDDAPAGAKLFASPGQPTQFVDAVPGGAVAAGRRALKRSDKGLAQDVVDAIQPAFELPTDAELFAHVWLDPQDPPKSIMLQYFSTGWLHRAVWGDYDAIPWGKAGTTERVAFGVLPEAGRWVRLTIPAARIGLKPGDRVSGFAVTQFGGTVYWDQLGVAGQSDPANDPLRSLRAWWKQRSSSDLKDLPAAIAPLVKQGSDAALTADQRKQLRDYYVQFVCQDTQPRFAPLRSQLDALAQQRRLIDEKTPSSYVFRDLDQPRDSFVMLRGQYNKPGEKVQPGTPAELPPLRLDDPRRRATRLDLARWLVSAENPLTARVAVNRVWQQVFGVGLVKTSFDFGSQGEPPSHPELLDWLAVDFQRRGWDTKSLVRDLVSTAAFCRSTSAPAESWQGDPENRLLARGPRIRLDGEQLRDNALAVSGLLDARMGGRGVNPYQPPNIWEPVGFVGSNTRNYVQDHGAALYRRSLYVFFKRTAPPPFLANFDAPNREQFCARRERSNTPLQALQLMNDVQHFEAARSLAARVLAEGGADDEQRVTFLYRVVLARPPQADELAVIGNALRHFRARFAADPAAAGQVLANGESPAPAGIPPVELAAFALVSNLVLNLDETVMRN